MKNLPLILLAAGQSTRAGIAKGLHPFQGTVWLRWQMRQFRKVGITRVILVLGYAATDYFNHDPVLREAETRWLDWEGGQLTVVVNHQHPLGPFSSFQCGTRHVEAKDDGAFVCPLDVPCPSRETWESLADEIGGDVHAVVPKLGGRGGHPIVLSTAFIDELLVVDPRDKDARLDVKIHSIADHHVRRVPVDDPRIQFNLNTPEEFAKFEAVINGAK